MLEYLYDAYQNYLRESFESWWQLMSWKRHEHMIDAIIRSEKLDTSNPIVWKMITDYKETLRAHDKLLAEQPNSESRMRVNQEQLQERNLLCSSAKDKYIAGCQELKQLIEELLHGMGDDPAVRTCVNIISEYITGDSQQTANEGDQICLAFDPGYSYV